MLRENVVLFKTTLANNYYSFSVARFRKTAPYQLLVTLWTHFKTKVIFLLFAPDR